MTSINLLPSSVPQVGLYLLGGKSQRNSWGTGGLESVKCPFAHNVSGMFLREIGENPRVNQIQRDK